MAIYLDSASVSEAQKAATLGIVRGITTNPSLLAREPQPPEEIIPALCETLEEGLVFYQLNRPKLKSRESEAHRFLALKPGRIGLKIPCTPEDLALLARLASHSIVCAATAVFSAHQAYLACEAGARYVIPYVNRASSEGVDGLALVRELADVCKATGGGASVLAASLKSPEQTVGAVLAGASDVTLVLDQIVALGDHPLTRQAVEEFSQAGQRD
jgi:transaldolase